MNTKHLIKLPLLNGLDIRNEPSIQSLRELLLDLSEQIEAIQAGADADERDLSNDELTEINKLFAQFEQTEDNIERRQRISAQTDKLRQQLTPSAEPNDPEPQNQPRNSSGGGSVGGQPYNVPNRSGSHNPGRQLRIQTIEDKGKWGWRHFGEFAVAVRSAGHHNGQLDPRLLSNAPTSYGQEGVGADGGFAVPPDFREAIMQQVMGEESLLSRTDQLTSSSNTITVPKDETTPWGTTGVRAYWEGEGDQLTQSKPALGDTTIKLNKLAALVPVTEELIEDAPGLESYLRSRVPEAMDSAINDKIIDGTGVGMPEGILQSGALISVAKVSGQAADTIKFQNIIDIWSRFYGKARSRAVWYINQDIEPQLLTMSFEGTSSSVPAYMPAGGLSQNPYATLMGRPVIPLEACKTLGNKGDIILADLSRYSTIIKTGGIRSDVSIHLFFDYDMVAFRFVFRMSGKSWFSSPITPQNGSATRSHFVTLDERA